VKQNDLPTEDQMMRLLDKLDRIIDHIEAPELDVNIDRGVF